MIVAYAGIGVLSVRSESEPLEHDIQSAFVKWAALACAALPALRLLYAIPNGGSRSKRTACLLKAEGVRAGVPDMHIPWPASSKASLYLEFKRATGSLSQEQKELFPLLAQAGNAVVVVRGLEAAIAVVRFYLAGRIAELPRKKNGWDVDFPALQVLMRQNKNPEVIAASTARSGSNQQV